MLTHSNQLDSRATTSTAAAGTFGITDVRWGIFSNSGNLMSFMVLNAQVINTRA